ncbi:MAG: phosphoribosylamine--glycine ligase [Spirochaetia bacterium]|jgi:phosphoribosylamine--glycine ligase|nr:phosphoribosylamine--glycine ligase [Spirochaetia bacterium]
MRVLILGSGAKDHALTWWFSNSKLISGLYAAPGNVGTESIAINLSYVDPQSPQSVIRACRVHQIDTVFIGTEGPLYTGVVEKLKQNGITVYGATAEALPLENDRQFSRDFAERHGIPIPNYLFFKQEAELRTFLNNHPSKCYVIKSNMQAPSRVMIDSEDKDALLAFSSSLLKNSPIIIEDHLSGLPLTVTLMLDGKHYLMLPLCSEYAKTGWHGTPTGGMGAISPVPVGEKIIDQIKKKIVNPFVTGLIEEHLIYKGVFTLSLINTEKGPVLVDFHVRFNDPAAQSIIPLINTDIAEICQAMDNQTLDKITLKVSDDSCTAVVVASQGYPQGPIINKPLKPIPSPMLLNTFADFPLFFFGCVAKKGCQLVTTGGRCVTVVGRANNILNANRQAYRFIDNISFEGSWYREDIGDHFFGR